MARLANAVVRGIDDTTSPAGARLVAAVAVLVGAVNVLVNTALDGMVFDLVVAQFRVEYTVALGWGPRAALWLLVPVWVLGSWVLVVLIRSFAAGTTDTIRQKHLLHEALPATVRTAVATAGGGALVAGGFAFGIAPGILLFAHLALVPVFVAVEDAGLLAAIRRSWRVAAANRIRMLVLATGAAVGGAATGAVSAVVTVGSPGVEFIVGVVAVTLFAVTLVGTLVDIRRQDEEGKQRGKTTGTPRSASAL